MSKRTERESWTVHTTKPDDGTPRVLDGGILGGMPDRRLAARLLYWWLFDNGHTSREAAATAAADLERNGTTSVAVNGGTVHAELKAGRR